MFQFIRRVSGSLFPRPDRPWRDDATSHAPTIGRKRTYSVAEHDDDDSYSASTAKRTKNDLVKSDAESDSAPEAEGPKAEQDVKEVTKGVKKVDLEDKDKAEDISPVRPEVVPLPDSPSGSPEPESNSPEALVKETEDLERADDKDSLASSAPENDVEGHEDSGRSEAVPVTTDVDTASTDDETAPASEVAVAISESDLHDTPETLLVKA